MPKGTLCIRNKTQRVRGMRRGGMAESSKKTKRDKNNTVQNKSIHTHQPLTVTHVDTVNDRTCHLYHRWLYERWNVIIHKEENISSLPLCPFIFCSIPNTVPQRGQHFLLPPQLQIKHRHTHKQTAMFVYPRTNALRYAHTCTAAARTNNSHGRPYLRGRMIESAHTCRLRGLNEVILADGPHEVWWLQRGVSKESQSEGRKGWKESLRGESAAACSC